MMTMMIHMLREGRDTDARETGGDDHDGDDGDEREW